MIQANIITKDKLIEQIRDVYETDVGDFKRKTALYLNRFYQFQKEEALKKQIQEIKHFVLYSESSSDNEMDEIDKLRFAVLEQLEKL